MAHGPQSAAVRVALHTPDDLLAAVPYVLGFHPADSIVLVGFDGALLVFTLRADLPSREDSAATRSLARQLADVAGERGVTEVVAVAYGPRFQVQPVMPGLISAIAQTGIGVRDAIGVTGRRYWSCLCEDPRCCPPEGIPYDPDSSPIPAAATVAGRAVLPDREALARQLEPVAGAAREAMRRATDRAEQRLCRAFDSGDVSGSRDRLAAEGVRLVSAVGSRREALSDDEVAWLSLLLLFPEVSDAALRQVWGRADPGEIVADLALWSDVTRRAEPELSAPPATATALAAWRNGDGALAGMAAWRAVSLAPDYPPARAVSEALAVGADPDPALSWSERGR